MIKEIKNLFATQKEEVVSDPPGKTFKKIFTGEFFSSEKEGTDVSYKGKERRKEQRTS